MKTLVKYIGTDDTLVRAEKGADKIEVKVGATFEMDKQLAEKLCKHYKGYFKIVGMAGEKEEVKKVEKKEAVKK